jgi:NTP pyrophosphatase (non-canonical NTP hydrolase)
MAQKRTWVMHWSTRGVYLRLEASELSEALRGKGTSSVKSEAADVLLVLRTITESVGIPV